MIYYITGGQRSGKSSFAQKLALQLTTEPIYLATARVWDEDFEKRIQRHQSDRDDRWTNIEQEKHLSQLDLENKVVVMDCVTLWLTNFFTDNQYQVDISLEQAKAEFEQFIQQNFTLIVISNELGMGLHAETEIGRKFTDLQGWMNQYIAHKADKAFFMVSGLAMPLK
jgi:adenosylcobinamide kinase / adenosylcobinamide-phosphate guanylyltransferase